MDMPGGASSTAPYAEYNAHIDACVSSAGSAVGSVNDAIQFKAKQTRGNGLHSKRKRARNRASSFKVTALRVTDDGAEEVASMIRYVARIPPVFRAMPDLADI